MIETQIKYQKNISSDVTLPDGVSFLASDSLTINTLDFSPFTSERYMRLPNVNSKKISQRYSDWANYLIKKSPKTCATIFYREEIVGYIFGSLKERSATFDLAVTSNSSRSSGIILYQAAAFLFNQCGASKMSSAFNSANIGALNAHVALQCRFVQATSIWLVNTDEFGLE